MVARKKKAGYWRSRLADFLHALLLLDAKRFGSRITPARPIVEFSDGVAESEQQPASTLDRGVVASTLF
jgi:CRISPR/Cas system-associated protein Cas7 (RAMP superfamily)